MSVFDEFALAVEREGVAAVDMRDGRAYLFLGKSYAIIDEFIEIEISVIETKEGYHGMGHGSALMNVICRAADQVKVPVLLEAFPFLDKGLSKESFAKETDRLIAFHGRFGFYSEDVSCPTEMRRDFV